MGDPLTSATTKAVGSVAAPAGKRLWRWWRPDISAAALATRADELAEVIQRTETARLEQLGVVRGAGVDVSFDALVRVRAGGGAEIGTLAEVGRYYRGLRTGRLVVLGEPGAGKTVVALHLLLDVLGHRLNGEGGPGPVPLRVNAASWDTAVSFTDWLAGVLASDYSLRPRAARMLIESGRILPVLDGLDEMDSPDAPPERARQGLDQLNETPWRGRAVIVMCRSGVYEAARALRIDGGDSGLHAATAVTLRPLTACEIRRHLDDSREAEGIDPVRWEPVTDQLAAEPAGVLATALSTPWLLTLAVACLRRRGPAAADELAAADDLESVQDHLFASLIPTAVAGLPRQRAGRRYTEGQVHGWLHNLARHLETRREQPRGGTDIALHELWEMAGNRTTRCLHGALVGLASSHVFGLVFGPVFALAAWLVVGLGIGLARSTAPKRVLWRTRREGGLRRRLAAGLKVGLPSGLAVGLAVGLVAHDEPALSERRMIRDDALAGLTVGLTYGLAVALTSGLTFGLAYGLTSGLTSGLAFGLAGGLVFGLVFAAATVRYACATLLFACRKAFPARPARFLNWAQHAGLLRVTGAAYQYRHETYRRWLLEHPTPLP